MSVNTIDRNGSVSYAKRDNVRPAVNNLVDSFSQPFRSTSVDFSPESLLEQGANSDYLQSLQNLFGCCDGKQQANPTGGANQSKQANSSQAAGKPEIDQFINFAAQAYGANPRVLSEIAKRESNYNTGDIPNNWDSNAKKGTPSKGMFQFIEPTFKSMMPQAKAANPEAWQGVSESWTDWKAQALTTAWAITHGKGNQWSTYRSALAAGGGSPRAAQ